MLVVMSIMPSYAAGFDLKWNGTPSTWAQDDLEVLVDYSILKKDVFGKYQDTITRLDFIYLAVTLYETIMGEEIKVDPKISFVDTNDIYVLKGATIGITSGIGNGKFGTTVKLTREQLATMMVKAIELTGTPLSGTSFKFADDSKISPYAKASIYKAYSSKFINGSNNMVNPKGNASIEQALLIFKNIYENFVLFKDSPNAEVQGRLNSEQIGLLSKSIVKIYVEDTEGNYSTGSGFIYEKGKIGTNYHVVENAKKIEIEFDDGTYYKGEVSVIGYDKEKDLAALSISQTTAPVIALGSSEGLNRGQTIYTIGSPKGLMNTLSSGIISSLRVDSIQISAPISPGSSGGVLLDEYGKVVGITSAGILEGENLGFAIPINLFKNMTKNQSLSLTKFVEVTNNKPKAVAYVSASPINANEIFLIWEDNGAKVYNLFEKIDNGEWTQLKNATGGYEFNSHDSDGLRIQGYSANQKVVYAVCVVENGVDSDYVFSNEVTTKSGALTADEYATYLDNNFKSQTLNGYSVNISEYKTEKFSNGNIMIFAYVDNDYYSNYINAEKSSLSILANDVLNYAKQFKAAFGKPVTVTYIYTRTYSDYPTAFVDNYMYDKSVIPSTTGTGWFVFYPLIYVDTENSLFMTWYSLYTF